MKYKLSEACNLVECSPTTLIKFINKICIRPLEEVVKGKTVKKLNEEMINKLKAFKIYHDKDVKIKRFEASWGVRKNIDPLSIINNYKQTKHFDFFSNKFLLK